MKLWSRDEMSVVGTTAPGGAGLMMPLDAKPPGRVRMTFPAVLASNGIINPAPPQAMVPTTLISSRDQSCTFYDAAITETTPGTGVEAALAAFDTQWTANTQSNHQLHPQNINPASMVSGVRGSDLREDNDLVQQRADQGHGHGRSASR